MKLDFLKKGLINTANFVPKFAFGDMNMHPGVLIINLLGRLLSIYLCFQLNAELDIKSLILAVLFPTLYIMYSIAVHGVDRILDIFGLERNTFEDIFKDTPDKCEERRGPDGDLPSIPDDKKLCESVKMGQSDSRVNCEAVRSTDTSSIGDARNYHGVCKYTGDGSTEYRSCSDLHNENICNGSELNCSWNRYPPSETVFQRCSRAWEMNNGSSRGISIEKCPIGCPYYYNQPGFIGGNYIATGGGRILKGTIDPETGIVTVGDDIITTDLSAETLPVIIIKISESSDTFKPLKSRDYFDHDIYLYSNGQTHLGGKVLYIVRNGSSLTSPVNTTLDQPLSAFTGDTYIFIKDANISGVDSTEKDESIRQILLDEKSLKFQISLKIRSNTCGEEFIGGRLSKVEVEQGVLGLIQTEDAISSYEQLQLTGSCRSR